MNYKDHVVSEWVPGPHGLEYQARVREQQGSFTCCLDCRYASSRQFAGITAGSIKNTFEEAQKTVLEWLAERTG